jgi:DnaJ family protein A protein 2
MADPYSILGVARDASKEDIKKAYRKLAMKHHPDKGGDPVKFQEISNAYDDLTNDKPRQDHLNPHDMFEQMFAGMHGHPFGNPFGGASFSARARSNAHEKKSIVKTLKLSLKDVCKGIRKELKIKDTIVCDRCKKQCPACGGSGMVQQQIERSMGFGRIVQVMNAPCSRCTGGFVISGSKSCSDCKGVGEYVKESNVVMNIPKGVANGTKFEHPNVLNKATLIFVVEYENDPNFMVDGQNLIHEVRISFMDALFGKVITVKHPDEETIEVDTNDMMNIPYTGMHHVIKNRGLAYGKCMKLVFKVVDFPRINKSSDFYASRHNIRVALEQLFST